MTDYFKNIDKNLLRTIFWGVMVLIIIISTILFYSVRKGNQEASKQLITVERVTSEFQLMEIKSKSPLIVDFKDVLTNQLYKDITISETCPLVSVQAVIGKKAKLIRFTNVNPTNNVQSYSFKGAYEELCTNIKFNPQSGDNYFKG